MPHSREKRELNLAAVSVGEWTARVGDDDGCRDEQDDDGRPVHLEVQQERHDDRRATESECTLEIVEKAEIVASTETSRVVRSRRGPCCLRQSLDDIPVNGGGYPGLSPRRGQLVRIRLGSKWSAWSSALGAAGQGGGSTSASKGLALAP